MKCNYIRQQQKHSHASDKKATREVFEAYLAEQRAKAEIDQYLMEHSFDEEDYKANKKRYEETGVLPATFTEK